MPCVAEPEATFPRSAEPTCHVESHSSFCSPFSPAEFLAAASNLSSSTATGPDKVAYLVLKHLPHSGIDFLHYIFNLSWTLHSFPSIWKTFSIIFIHKMGKPLNSPASFRSISSPPAYQSCLNASFYPVRFSFWNLIPFSLPPGRFPPGTVYSRSSSLSFSVHFGWV